MLPIKKMENLLLVSSRLYHLVMVKRLAGMKPASQILHLSVRGEEQSEAVQHTPEEDASRETRPGSSGRLER